MKPNKGVGAILLSAAVLLTSCHSGDAEPRTKGSDEQPEGAASFNQPLSNTEAYPVFVSSEVVVGHNRFLVGLLDGDNDAPIASPEIEMDITFFDLEHSAERPADSADMDFLWTIKPRLGLYVADVNFPSAGRWGARVAIEGKGIDETVKAGFDVADKPATPALGTRPPASDTPTGEDVSRLSQISTDPDPDPRFYDLSIAQALKSGAPSVITFATPKFCQTATCGPALDIVKSVSDEFPKLNFVHVEPYRLPYDNSNPTPVEAAREWGLPTEPWIFVTDSRGRLAAKFEGVAGAAELRRTLTRL